MAALTSISPMTIDFFQTSVGSHERQSELHSFQFSKVERVTFQTQRQPNRVRVRFHGLRPHRIHHAHGHSARPVRSNRGDLSHGAHERRHGRGTRQLRHAQQPVRSAKFCVELPAAAAAAAAQNFANRDSPAVRPFKFAGPKSPSNSVQQSSLPRPAFGQATNV